MGSFEFIDTGIQDLLLIRPEIFNDNRGSFMETFRADTYEREGMPCFVQENQSFSVKSTLRGLHFQKYHPQGKLVRAVCGTIYDVAVDIRPASETFGKWFGVLLSGVNNHQLFIPEGFAHGFLTLSDHAVVIYKCTDYYHPEDQHGIIWNDEELGIKWPLESPAGLILSEKDRNLPSFSDVKASIRERGCSHE